MSENKRDYYDVLGVTRDATQDDIRIAFRHLAKENHPDRHPGEPEYNQRFAEINDAYKILSNPDDREKYDRYGHAAFDPNANPWSFGGIDEIFNMFTGGLGEIFGTRSQRSNPYAPRQGGNAHGSVTLSFEEAVTGCEKQVQVETIEVCNDCKGSGAEPGSEIKSCPDCGGTGRTRTTQRTLFGMAQSIGACTKCRGTGKYVPNPCKACHGTGRVKKTNTYTVKIPAGIDDGMAIPLHGKGHPGQNGGEPGDAIIQIIVQPSPVFDRDGVHVYLQRDISFPEAALGAEIEVPTIDGKVSLTIPEGTETGTTFRLKGKGFPDVNRPDYRGDEYVKVRIAVPKHMSGEQKNKLREYAKSMENTSTLKSRLFGGKK